MSLGATPHPLTLKDGSQFNVDSCRCSICGNQWWVRSSSPEFLPSYCPYCGSRFKSRLIETNDERPT